METMTLREDVRRCCEEMLGLKWIPIPNPYLFEVAGRGYRKTLQIITNEM